MVKLLSLEQEMKLLDSGMFSTKLALTRYLNFVVDVVFVS